MPMRTVQRRVEGGPDGTITVGIADGIGDTCGGQTLVVHAVQAPADPHRHPETAQRALVQLVVAGAWRVGFDRGNLVIEDDLSPLHEVVVHRPGGVGGPWWPRWVGGAELFAILAAYPLHP